MLLGGRRRGQSPKNGGEAIRCSKVAAAALITAAAAVMQAKQRSNRTTKDGLSQTNISSRQALLARVSPDHVDGELDGKYAGKGVIQLLRANISVRLERHKDTRGEKARWKRSMLAQSRLEVLVRASSLCISSTSRTGSAGSAGRSHPAAPPPLPCLQAGPTEPRPPSWPPVARLHMLLTSPSKLAGPAGPPGSAALPKGRARSGQCPGLEFRATLGSCPVAAVTVSGCATRCRPCSRGD